MKKAFTLIELLIVVAIIAILAAIAVPNFLEAQTRAKIARVLSDQRTYATALETYQIDSGTYPLQFPYNRSPLNTGAAPTGYPTMNINAALVASVAAANRPNPDPYSTAKLPSTILPSFAHKNAAAGVQPTSLTTPVSYLNTYVPDTFATFKQATFSYATGPSGFILWSPGADGADQLGRGSAGDILVFAGQSLPSPYLVAGPGNGTTEPNGGPAGGAADDAFTYDATNGTASAGDTYRVK